FGLDKELLLERGRELVGDEPCQHVGGAARRKGADHAHRPRRPFVGGSRCCLQRDGEDQGCAAAYHPCSPGRIQAASLKQEPASREPWTSPVLSGNVRPICNLAGAFPMAIP